MTVTAPNTSLLSSTSFRNLYTPLGGRARIVSPAKTSLNVERQTVRGLITPRPVLLQGHHDNPVQVASELAYQS